MDYLTANISIIINFIAGANFILCLIAACSYLLLTRKATEFVFVAFGIVLLDLIHQAMRYELKKYFECTSCLEVVNALWFMGYALSDMVLILVLLRIFKWKKMLKDRVSQTIMYIYMFMAFIQIATYIEHIYTDFVVFTYLYQVIIPILNIAMTIIICGFVLKLALIKLGKGFLLFIMSVRGGSKWTL